MNTSWSNIDGCILHKFTTIDLITQRYYTDIQVYTKGIAQIQNNTQYQNNSKYETNGGGGGYLTTEHKDDSETDHNFPNANGDCVSCSRLLSVQTVSIALLSHFYEDTGVLYKFD